MFSFMLPKKSMLIDPKINKYIMERDFKLGMYNKRASGIAIKQNNDIIPNLNEKNNNLIIQSSSLFVILASVTSFCYYFLFRKSS